jgi:CheY-like chemotaxis protein
MARLLTDAGYRVVGCADLRRAATVVRSERPAGVILELRRRYERIGWALVQELRDGPAARAIPAPVCSADTGSLQRRADAHAARRRHPEEAVRPPDLTSRLTALLAPAPPAPEDGAGLAWLPPDQHPDHGRHW